MTPDLWLVRYSEIFLKSEPVRRSWEKMLQTALAKRMPDAMVTRERGRIWITGAVEKDVLEHTFGIASYSPCRKTTVKTLIPDAVRYAEEAGCGNVRTFAVRVHRVGTHPFTSQEIAGEIGAAVCARWPDLRVNLKEPDFTLRIEIRENNAYLFHEEFVGPGGLPGGSAGTMVSLLSGGIDSPVATYLMMKRGVFIIPVYIRIHPFHDDRSEERVRILVDVLKVYQPEINLIVIEDSTVYENRMLLRKMDLERYSCVLCKRHLYRTAETIARERKANGIITGESLAQVASQTADNLAAIDRSVSLPVYRPLIGFDKEETILIARRIGTFEPSILPVPSCCCTIPFRPATTCTAEKAEALEAAVTDLKGRER
jgi:thiamine biosynthesis protein ThiI